MIVKSRNVWLDGAFSEAAIAMDNGVISDILPYDTAADTDFGDARIVPGFIDIHTHGAFGIDTNTASPEELLRWGKMLPREGVTAFLPTTITDTVENLSSALSSVAKATGKGGGAEILGAHLEGPFIDGAHRGAHPEELILPPSVQLFSELQQAAEGCIRVVTLAPEREGGEELVRFLQKNGIAASIGHSGCSYDEALAAIEWGALGMTHVYNGMSPMHHRDPGLLGATLSLPDIYGEIIADGLHCHPAAAAIFYRCKDAHHPIMITDSLAPKGCKAGEGYRVGGEDVTLGEDGLARISGSATIAGSTLFMNEGLRNMVEKAGVPFSAALASCTENPAAYLGISHRKGSIAEGLDADIAVLAEDYTVLAAFCRGKAAF